MHLSKGEHVRFGVCDLEHCGTHIKICIYTYYLIIVYLNLILLNIYLDIRYCTIDWQADAAGP